VRWLRQAPCLPVLPHLTLCRGQYPGYRPPGRRAARTWLPGG